MLELAVTILFVPQRHRIWWELPAKYHTRVGHSREYRLRLLPLLWDLPRQGIHRSEMRLRFICRTHLKPFFAPAQPMKTSPLWNSSVLH